jgi:hypothetical protein
LVSKLNIKNYSLLEEVNNLTTKIEMLTSQLKDVREDYKELAKKAVERPTTSNKTIQINNYIKNMPPLLKSDIVENVQMLTLDHHTRGAEGYAQYAMDFPFKDKIATVDASRNKIKYKNEEGDVIEDAGFKKMMKKLCIELKDRSFNLSKEHYNKLSDKFCDAEMEAYDFMSSAIAIAKYASGHDNEFCKDIIKMIGKGSII